MGSEEISSQFDAGAETVKVIVSLYEPMTLRNQTDWSSSSSVEALRTEIAIRQASVLSALSSSEFTLRYQYENQTAFSGEVTLEGLDSLVSHSLVQYVEPVRQKHTLLAQSIPLANASVAREIYDGGGVAVAIVDSGVDYTHPMLGGGAFPNTKVIGGFDTGENDADPFPGLSAHGTAVSGIAAGSLGFVGDYIGGVAYNASIYALKADDAAGILWDDALLAAWDWCITNQNADPANPIMVINNSWGSVSVFYNDADAADAAEPAYANMAQTAVDAGITILASSGNAFQTDGIASPAALSNVISVGAVYDTTDQVTEYSNTADILDILAPADPMYTTDIVGTGGYTLGDYVEDFGGTSSACPFAAGSVAMIQSASMDVTGAYLMPDDIRTLLVASGDPVTDTKVAITKPRVNVGQALNVQDSGPIYVEEGSSIENDWWDAETMTWDPESHNLSVDDDPLFVTGPQGYYYLSQIEAGQTEESPCVDTGSDDAHFLGMYRHTTRTDNWIDEGIIDMGYHHLLSTVFNGDFNYDGFVDFCQQDPVGEDLIRFLLHWLDSGCGYPDWCHEKDLNQDGVVNFMDYAMASSECGVSEVEPPQPDPMTWETPPYAVDSGTISMTATQAVDDYSGFEVEYYFECFSGPGHDRDWGPDRSYTDIVDEEDTYCYHVKARDALGNETDWSSTICVTLSGGGQEPDAPNPPSNLIAAATSSVQIDLAWTDNSDNETGFRIERSDDGVTFVQIDTVGANVTAYSDIGLQPNTTYWYRVRAYNGEGNSAYSNEADTQPPLPNPSVWASLPQEVAAPSSADPTKTTYWHTMTATTASDAATGGNDPVEYYFQCYDTSSFDSGWRSVNNVPVGETPETYLVEISSFPKRYKWRFRTRDQMGNVTQWSELVYVIQGGGGGGGGGG
jgi:subtilisin family serine protease